MATPLPKRRRFTVEDYHRMIEAGVLTEEDRCELIEGEIVEKMTIGSRHAACVNRLTRLLVTAVGDRALVTVQNPVGLSDLSEPEPDVAVVKPRSGDYGDRHPVPDDVLLLIEVADTTLPFDRGVKVPLYARAGIPEVWLVNLEANLVEAFLGPGIDGYRDVRRAHRGETLRPAAFPELTIDVDRILPP